jgi:hypothetical protein
VDENLPRFSEFLSHVDITWQKKISKKCRWPAVGLWKSVEWRTYVLKGVSVTFRPYFLHEIWITFCTRYTQKKIPVFWGQFHENRGNESHIFLHVTQINFYPYLPHLGAWGGVVVKVLRY